MPIITYAILDQLQFPHSLRYIRKDYAILIRHMIFFPVPYMLYVSEKDFQMLLSLASLINLSPF